jgi:putative acetyltransferase
MGFVLRPIRPEDDPAVARVIRAVMPEYGARGPGFAINDPEVDAMSAAYPAPRAVYFVLDVNGAVVGGGGVGPLAGGDVGTCELRKMYFLPEARGLGAGKALLARCIEEGRARGYRRMYLETLTGMDKAQRLYERFGFARLDEPVGATGHFGCDRWYALDLAARS